MARIAPIADATPAAPVAATMSASSLQPADDRHRLGAAGAAVLDWLRPRFELGRAGAAGHLAPMEGLRGFAVALVFLVHYATLVQPWLAPGGVQARAFDALHAVGNAGVDLFFVLSGFLIYGALMRAPSRFRPYFGRRLRRIYPPFICVFGVYLVLSVVLPSESKLPSDRLDALVYLLANLLLLPGMLPIEPVITVAWSLSYEVFYYLAMPGLIALLSLRRRAPAVRAGLFGVMAVAILGLAPSGSPIRLVMFLSGVLVHEALVARPRAVPGSAVAALATFGALTLLPVPLSSGSAHVKLVALFVAFFLLCLACFARPASRIARAFCATGLRWLGNMSYSYYLIHGLALKAFFLAFGHVVAPHASAVWPVLLLLPAFASTLVPSAVLFLVVERPFSLHPSRSTAGARPGVGNPV